MTALVTGVSRGIGRAVALELIRQGDVVGVYRQDHAAAQRLAAALAGEAAKLRSFACDLCDPEAREGLLQRLSLGGEHFRGVVLNAGVAHYSAFVGSSATTVDPLLSELRSNLEAPLLLLRGLLEAKLVADGAAVVFMSSNLVRHALAGHVGYSAAKAGLEGAVKQLCAELGPSRIRVNAVAPGLIRTDMTAHLGEAEMTVYAEQVPLGRVGRPEDVAQCVSFLLSEQSAYISGQVIDVDGGWGCR
ncbi:MAG: SDR family oxidoreductase [Polyangiaceae bacterium]